MRPDGACPNHDYLESSRSDFQMLPVEIGLSNIMADMLSPLVPTFVTLVEDGTF